MIVKILGAVATLTIMSIGGGLILKVLWLWFFVPTGLTALSYAQAIGIFLTIVFVTHKYEDESIKLSSDEFWSRVTTFLVYSLVTISIGWVVQLFM